MATEVAHQASPARLRRAPAWTNHTPEELAFSHRAGEVYFFTAPSASVPGKVNTVAYHPGDRSAHCDCVAGEAGRYECWHAHHAEGAWLLHLCRQLVRQLGDEELTVAGREAATRVRTAEWFGAAHAPIDPIAAPMLQACRDADTVLVLPRLRRTGRHGDVSGCPPTDRDWTPRRVHRYTARAMSGYMACTMTTRIRLA